MLAKFLRTTVLLSGLLAAGAAAYAVEPPSREAVQEAFVDVARSEIVTGLAVDLDPDTLEAIQRHEQVHLEDAQLLRAWPYALGGKKPVVGQEPPAIAVMFPNRPDDLESAITTKDWVKFYVQFGRLVGTLDGHDQKLRAPPCMDASLLLPAEFDAVANQLQAAFGGNLATWKKAVPAAQRGVAKLTGRAVPLLLAYAQRKDLLTALGMFAVNGITKDYRTWEGAVLVAKKNQYIGYNLGLTLKPLKNYLDRHDRSDTYGRFYELFQECAELKAYLEKTMPTYFPVEAGAAPAR